jgi:hypothetical protein
MQKIKLESKGEKKLTITRREKNSSNYIPANDPEMFPLLTDNRFNDELFSRVDKYWVNHYYYVGTEQLKETIFYPSSYGIEQIESEKDHPCKKLYERLVDEGIGLKGERPVPNIKKPVKRLELECKPKRMRLECNE